MISLVGDADMIQAGGLAIMNFRRFRCEFVAHMYWFGKINCCVQRHRKIIAVIAGEGKCAISQRESNATMYNAKTIDHF